MVESRTYNNIGCFCSFNIGTCTHGDLKLVGDDDCDEGLVEVCLNGHWGTVNIEGWDANEATVVCKQLGYYARG